ncbi:MAG: glycerophosphodiester phosphodiesterase [Caldilineaceae bacterium]|nr:glycerophosphodiester phosphodiesterase [Caldilineaceae bacterium]
MARRVQIFAHRGAKRAAPENTLPAFQTALDMGVDGIELDVQCSKDGILVIMHNYTVDATTNGVGKVSDFTAAELAQLDAGSYFGLEFSGVGVPTLDHVFDLVGNRCQVNVEVKSNDPSGGPEVDAVVETIGRRNLYDQVIVSSFNPISLIKLRWMDNRVRLGLLYGEELPLYLRDAWMTPILQPEALHPHHTLVNADLVAWAKSISCAVNTWTVNDVEEARRLAALGVDTLISDVPDQLIAALG